MKKLITLIALATNLTNANAQGKVLDTTFGTKGKVITEITLGAFDDARSVVCQSDGKIIAAGTSGLSYPTGAATIVRYTSNGQIDLSFGTNGIVTLNHGTSRPDNGSIAIQKIGSTEYIIYYTRFNDPVTYEDTAIVARYKLNGSLDGSFGTNGIVELPDYVATKMIVDQNGKILLAGTPADTTAHFNVVRLTANGQFDNSFGTGGYTLRAADAFSGSSQVLAVQNDGKILAGGFSFVWPTAPDYRMAVVRYNTDGSIDNSFGIGGYVKISANNDKAEAHGIALQSTGKIIVGGFSDTGTNNRFYVTRLNANGTVDNSFGTNGYKRFDFNNAQCNANEVLVQSDDKIYLAGWSAHVAGGYRFAICRFNANGIPDNTWGTNGGDTSNVAKWSEGLAACFTPGKSIIVAGFGTQTYEDFALMKYLTGLKVGIIDLKLKNQPLLYPNPVSSTINLSYELQQEEMLTLQLVDIIGRTVQVFKTNEKQSAGKHKEMLQLDGAIATGQYVLQFIGIDGVYSVKVQVRR